MSAHETSSGSDSEEVIEFKCRKCPGKLFKASERDEHRRFHKQQKEKERKRRPGPKSKTTRSSLRHASPEQSDLTLFQPVQSPPPKAKGTKRKTARQVATPGPSSKRQSTKHYDKSVINSWSKGTGA